MKCWEKKFKKLCKFNMQSILYLLLIKSQLFLYLTYIVDKWYRKFGSFNKYLIFILEMLSTYKPFPLIPQFAIVAM